jgi:hypothetical protein
MQAIDERGDLGAAVQAYGALATQLTAAVGRGRRGLEAHAAVLPAGTLANLDTLLAEFARKRLRIAIYGEVKAGKSTLLNAIAGAALSPVGFEPLTTVPVRVTYGPCTAWRVGERQLDSVAQLERVMRDPDPGPRDTAAVAPGEVVVETDLDLLELGGQVDLLDTPGVGSAAQLDAISATALRSLDAVVLVVRYPALFTQFTRRLMENLQSDIGKLFVVWNLDADCAELDADERARHAANLRANVAGAHELFLVDARAGFRAMQAGDGAASVASGLTAFIAALRRFASSGGREVAALREAAKGVRQRFTEAHQCLAERQAALDRALTQARARIRSVEVAADAASGAARRQLADFEGELTHIGQQANTTAAKLAADLRRQLRGARRRWVRRGHIGALQAAITSAVAQYGTVVEAANKTTHDAVQAEAARFGTTLAARERTRTEPAGGPLAPEERSKRATHGRWQLLRRALWHRWYLPGLDALERTGISTDLAAQAAWCNTLSQAARDAAGATLASRLAEIKSDAEAQIAQIKVETAFTANETEVQRLGQDLPVVAAQLEAVTRINAEARALL